MINLQSDRWINEACFVVLAATVVLGTYAVAHLLRSNNIPQLPALSVAAAWPIITPDAFTFNAEVFKKTAPDPGGAITQGSAAKRFRLAGTFFAVGMNQQSRKAILDDLQKKEQLLVTEGDLIDHAQGVIENETRVLSIMSDRVILRKGSMEEQIMLCFAGNSQPNAQASSASKDKSQAEIQNRFGKRVGDKRWVLMKSELLGYYKEVLNNTDRLAKIYDSLKPVYQGQSIAGYSLGIEGEGDMFAAFGLQEGDIIRQVNSMPMTSQARAEYFINEFVKNRVNGFVLDIERSGRKEKLIYMVR